jgi:hypothetical protein
MAGALSIDIKEPSPNAERINCVVTPVPVPISRAERDRCSVCSDLKAVTESPTLSLMNKDRGQIILRKWYSSAKAPWKRCSARWGVRTVI